VCSVATGDAEPECGQTELMPRSLGTPLEARFLQPLFVGTGLMAIEPRMLRGALVPWGQGPLLAALRAYTRLQRARERSDTIAQEEGN
jgi:hypothetical protein